MNREVHVRFWEGVGVKFSRATQLMEDGGLFSTRPRVAVASGAARSPPVSPLTRRRRVMPIPLPQPSRSSHCAILSHILHLLSGVCRIISIIHIAALEDTCGPIS
jgi:hypothetical protein